MVGDLEGVQGPSWDAAGVDWEGEARGLASVAEEESVSSGVVVGAVVAAAAAGVVMERVLA